MTPISSRRSLLVILAGVANVLVILVLDDTYKLTQASLWNKLTQVSLWNKLTQVSLWNTLSPRHSRKRGCLSTNSHDPRTHADAVPRTVSRGGLGSESHEETSARQRFQKVGRAGSCAVPRHGGDAPVNNTSPGQ
jgi:hypothetical protein